MLFTLDAVGSNKVIRNAVVSENINIINSWIGFYVSEGYLPQIRMIEQYQPCEEVQTA